MSSTVTCSCTPRLGSFVVEIPSMTWSYSGFTEMGCYKPSPATWMVGLSIDVFFAHFVSHPHDDTIQKCCESGCWWFYRTPWYSQGLYQFLGVQHVFMMFFVAAFLPTIVETETVSLWKLVDLPPRVPGCQSSHHQDYCHLLVGNL